MSCSNEAKHPSPSGARLFASLNCRAMSAPTGTLEGENHQPVVTPSEAEGSKALRPQSSCALDFSTPLEKTISYQ